MGEVAVRIGGRTLAGWSSLTISSSLSTAVATLAIAGESLPAQSLNGLERVEVTYEGETAFTGYLDDVSVDWGARGTSVRANGRSLASDLVDSSLDREKAPAESIGEDLVTLVQRYLELSGADLGLDVSLVLPQIPLSLPRIPRHAPSVGESYWSAIERICRVAGVICTSTPTGKLALISPTRFQRADTALVEGDNVIGLRGKASWGDRAHRVIAEGKGAGMGDDWAEDLSLRAVAVDESVRPSRTSVVQVEGAATQQELEARAGWEVAVRGAGGSSFSAVVNGWRMPDLDQLWSLGSIVLLRAPSLLFAGSLVVDGIEHRFSSGGETTQVTLARKEAYRTEPRLASADEPTDELAGGGW